jgi:hypothetical protein
VGKAEDKRAAIVAKQAEREAAEREARRAAGLDNPTQKARRKWTPGMSGPGRPRGRPPKPVE